MGVFNKQQVIRRKLQNHFKNKKEIPDYLFSHLKLVVPDNFDLFDNPNEVVAFFNQCIDIIKKYCDYQELIKIHIIMDNVTKISIDSIMYLIAISSNKYADKIRFTIHGPKNEKVAEFLLSTGIANYLNNTDNLMIPINDAYFSIKNGNKSDGGVAASICDFVNENLQKDIVYSRFLYDMLIEMMTNTEHHAFGNKRWIFQNQWFVFIENALECIKFTFLDMGLGIPDTMLSTLISVKSVLESEEQIIFFENDAKLLSKTLREGNFVSRTKKSNRGKGLPEIYSHYSVHKKTSNFKVMSGKGMCYFKDEDRNKEILLDLVEKFTGTLFYWEIKK